jgi:hypothetical protein
METLECVPALTDIAALERRSIVGTEEEDHDDEALETVIAELGIIASGADIACDETDGGGTASFGMAGTC